MDGGLAPNRRPCTWSATREMVDDQGDGQHKKREKFSLKKSGHLSCSYKVILSQIDGRRFDGLYRNWTESRGSDWMERATLGTRESEYTV